jgi:flagellar hook-associated protein 3 FlgL
MAITRVATLQQTKLTTGFTLRTQREVFEDQVRVATGKKAQTYAGIAEDAPRLVNMENALTRTEQYLDNISLAEQRINLMSTTLEAVDDLAREFRGQLAVAINGDAAFDTTIWQQAQNLMVQITDLLNQRDGTRYLFGGSRADAPPVSLDPANFAAIDDPPLTIGAAHPDAGLTAAIPNLTYYQGSTETAEASVRADELLLVEYGVKANEPAIAELMTALDIVRDTVIAGPPVTNGERDRIEEALSRVSYAIEGIDPTGALPNIDSIGNVAAKAANAAVTLDGARERHENFVVFATDVIAELENADTAEAVARLNSNRVALEISFSALARLQQLTLANYL